VSVLNTDIKGVCVYCMCVLVSPVIISKVTQRSFPLTILLFSQLHYCSLCIYVHAYMHLYCVGVEEDRGHFLMPK